jgi:hypothetical protein
MWPLWKRKKEASGKRSSLEKTRKTHVSPDSIHPVKLHDWARVGRYDQSGQLSVQATIQWGIIRALYGDDIGYLADGTIWGHQIGDVAIVGRAIYDDFWDVAVGGDGGEKAQKGGEGREGKD